MKNKSVRYGVSYLLQGDRYTAQLIEYSGASKRVLRTTYMDKDFNPLDVFINGGRAFMPEPKCIEKIE